MCMHPLLPLRLFDQHPVQVAEMRIACSEGQLVLCSSCGNPDIVLRDSWALLLESVPDGSVLRCCRLIARDYVAARQQVCDQCMLPAGSPRPLHPVEQFTKHRSGYDGIDLGVPLDHGWIAAEDIDHRARIHEYPWKVTRCRRQHVRIPLRWLASWRRDRRDRPHPGAAF